MTLRTNCQLPAAIQDSNTAAWFSVDRLINQLIVSPLIGNKKHTGSQTPLIFAVLKMSQTANTWQPISRSAAAQSVKNVSVPVSILRPCKLERQIYRFYLLQGRGCVWPLWPASTHVLIPHLHTQIWRSLHVREWIPLLGWRPSVWLHRGSASRSDGWTRSLGAESWRDQTELVNVSLGGVRQPATKHQQLNLTVMEKKWCWLQVSLWRLPFRLTGMCWMT